MARLILDTGVLIAAARGSVAPEKLLADSDDIAIPAIVVAEYLAGVDGDPSPPRADVQRRFLEELLEAVPVCEYSLSTAREHGVLLAHVRAAGRPRGSHDLIIAATARATRRTVLTTDIAAGFAELPGVDVREIDLTRG